MALIQEMAVKIDQDFLAALLALFTPVSDAQADRQKVKQSSKLTAQRISLSRPSPNATLDDGAFFFNAFVLPQTSTCLQIFGTLRLRRAQHFPIFIRVEHDE